MNRVRSPRAAETSDPKSHADALKFSLRDVLMFLGGVGVILGAILGAWLRFENRVTTIEVGHGQRLTTIESDVGEIKQAVIGPRPDERQAGFTLIPQRADHEH